MRTPPNPALAEAINLARDRLDNDNDAYADQDLLERLLAGIDAHLDGSGSVRGELVTMLRATTAAGAQIAADIGEPIKGGDISGQWRASDAEAMAHTSNAAFALLQALAIAPHDDAAFMPDDERGAAAEMVAELNASLTRTEHRASHLLDFLDKLAREFEDAGTHTAARVAARIRAELDR